MLRKKKTEKRNPERGYCGPRKRFLDEIIFLKKLRRKIRMVQAKEMSLKMFNVLLYPL